MSTTEEDQKLCSWVKDLMQEDLAQTGGKSATTLNFDTMSPADAKHNLEVLRYLFEYQDALKSIAAREDVPTLSMAGIVAAGGFNRARQTNNEDDDISVVSTRFLPVEIHLFSDGASLDEVPDPGVALKIGEHRIYPVHDDDSDPIKLARVYGIEPGDDAWTSIDPYASF